MARLIQFTIFTFSKGLFLLFWYGVYYLGEMVLEANLLLIIGSFVLALVLGWIVEVFLISLLPKKYQ